MQEHSGSYQGQDLGVVIRTEIQGVKQSRIKFMKSSMERTDEKIREQTKKLREDLVELWLHIANLQVGDYRPMLDYLATQFLNAAKSRPELLKSQKRPQENQLV